MRKSVLALLGSAVGSTATIPTDLVACLINDAGCTVTSIEGETGSLETPHPYSNNGLYIFTVSPPAGSPDGKAYKVTFDEFEVDGNADGDCHDEVWIMDSAGTPLAGPFCGFDDAFSVGMVPGLPDGTNQADSEHYDYYYEQLLNTHNLGDMAGGGLFFSAPLVVGLKTDRTVHNYGFKLSYDLSGCQPGYQIQDDGSCAIVFDETTNKIPAGLPGCGATATTVPVPSGGRIDGGSSATRGSWPWLVRIKINSSTMDQCSGTILDNETVLTTARCCHAAGDVSKMKVFVGEHDQRTNDEVGEFQVDPVSFASHPEYNADGNSFADRAHDHCVVKIPNLENNKNAECDGCFTSICLPSEGYQPGRACWTAGWGALHSENNQKSAKLRSVGINIMPWDYCEANSNYMFFQLSKDAEFCAGMPDVDGNAATDGGVGPCNGDQGSPLICDDGGNAVLYGQYSWATQCGVEGYPAIYADVFPELDWISSQMGAEDPAGPADPVWDEITDNVITPGLTCTGPDAGRIFGGGTNVQLSDDWGFMVHFSSAKRLDDGSMDWTQGVDCAGTIVDDEWVVTSEECCMKLIENVSCDYTDITMAFMDPNTKNPDAKQFYQQPNDFRFQDGVCMMRTEPLNWAKDDGSVNEYTYACLPDSHDVPAGTKCWTAGWGEINSKGDFSNKLRSLALNVFDNDWCAAKSAYESVEDTKFCAGRPNNSGGIAAQYDTCERDLGGPLICEVNGAPVVYGVLSSGNECSQPDIKANPSLFTRLGDADISTWIRDILDEPPTTPEPTTTEAPPECGFETEVPVDWMTGSKTSKMWRKGPNSMMVRYRNFRNQASFNFRNKEYLGFLTFRKDKCGQDFLDAWTDGRIFHYTIYDSGVYYDFGNSTPFYFENENDSSLNTVTIQYRQIKSMITKNLPKNNQSKDDVYFAISGTDSVNWGSKDPDACLVGAKNGVLKMPDFDASGDLDYASCVGKEMTWKN